jgi:hypothetical protein
VNRSLCNSSRRQCVLRAPVRASVVVSRAAAQSRLRGLVRFALRAVCPAAGATASKRSCVVVRSLVVAVVRRTGRCAVGAARERMHLPVMRSAVRGGKRRRSAQRANAACFRERRFGSRALLHVQPRKMQPMRSERPNPSIERTSKRLRLFAAAHVERYAPGSLASLQMKRAAQRVAVDRRRNARAGSASQPAPLWVDV